MKAVPREQHQQQMQGDKSSRTTVDGLCLPILASAQPIRPTGMLEKDLTFTGSDIAFRIRPIARFFLIPMSHHTTCEYSGVSFKKGNAGYRTVKVYVAPWLSKINLHE
jgi:hypothetical protein